MLIQNVGLIKDVRNYLVSVKNRMLYRKETIQICELFKTDRMTLYHHASVALRYNYVIGYLEGNDALINDYITAHKNNYKHIGKYYDQNRDINNFNRLIKSFQQYGYKSSSELYIDEIGNIYNGAHRLALCVYFGIEGITVRRIKKTINLYNPESIISIYNIEGLYNRLNAAYDKMITKIRINS